MNKRLSLYVVAALALASMPGAALAHAKLVGSTPAANSRRVEGDIGPSEIQRKAHRIDREGRIGDDGHAGNEGPPR